MRTAFKGNAWNFGDNVDTDQVIPAEYLVTMDSKELAKYAFSKVSPEFPKKVKAGDIIVAGRNFGCGSSREQAVMALKRAGIAAIVARSYARIFYRNSINLGLHVFESDDAYDAFPDGARVSLDPIGHALISLDGAKTAQLKEIPHHARKILDSGGLVPHLKERFGEKQDK